MNIVLDVETIGETFLIVTHTIETGETQHFWEADLEKFRLLYRTKGVTFITFNGTGFDMPLVQAFVDNSAGARLKKIATTIIEEGLRPWQTQTRFEISDVEADFIDLKEPAPGVMLSLKIYEGRMHFPHLKDMPVDHTADISASPRLKKIVLDYCINDVMATAELFKTIRSEITLRETMTSTYGIDLRSKSGAQAAESILRKKCDIPRQDITLPAAVSYSAPPFITTDNPQIQALLDRIEAHVFTINPKNGSPTFPDFLKEPVRINKGIYQFGIGGLHSKHDIKLHIESKENLLISDFDVASYYPSLMIKANIVPDLPKGKGEVFIQTYTEIFNERLEAKRQGDKLKSNSLKLILNSTFGKLGNQYCSFYSPDLMLAVTITGQLNLLILIDELERIETVTAISANTDGIALTYAPEVEPRILAVLATNTEKTGFEYEQTPYREVAYRDVNSYLAVTTDGKLKRKGAFSQAGVLEGTNPTFQICAEAAARYLLDKFPIDETIRNCTDIRQFVAIRNVTGGGVQHFHTRCVDDWVLIKDTGTKDNVWQSASTNKTVTRKSRPGPLHMDTGGKPFGRVARWYRSIENLKPISYVVSGNRVPDSENACLCLDLPTAFPKDVDYAWYIARAKTMLVAAGLDMSQF